MIPGVIVAMSAAGILYLWYRERARRLSSDRLASWIGKAADVESRQEPAARTIRSFPPRHPCFSRW